MVTVCHGVFLHTYYLNMWWVSFLKLPIIQYTLHTLTSLCSYKAEFLNVIKFLRPPEPPYLISCVMHHCYRSCHDAFKFPSVSCCLFFTALLEWGGYYICFCLKMLCYKYFCVLVANYLQSFGLSLLSLLYNGIFYSSVLSLCYLYSENNTCKPIESTDVSFLTVGNDDC